MEITGKSKLEKLRRKNRGNNLLSQAIDQLVDDLENRDCSNQQQLKKIRPDADLVHNDGFYIFNIQVHRVMILIEFEDNGEATIIWCGSHDEYETTFKNNKSTIKKWLNNQGLIN
jgi:mRNA interferase HigB